MPTSQRDSIAKGPEFFNLFYIGINIENVLYGMELFLYFKTMRILLCNKGTRKKARLFYALFSTVMVLLVTIWVATQAMFGEKMWLIDADFPGGPSAYWRTYIAIWYIDWGTTAIVILQLMTDALMIYRCQIIWSSYRVVALPIILWLVTFTFGVLVDWTTSSPGGDYFTGLSTPLSLTYWSISVFLTMSMTSMICYRVLRHGRMVRQHIGHEYASSYFTMVTIIVESVLPYTLSGIAAVVSLGVGSRTSVTFISVYSLMMCISPQMLILRVAAGKAWKNDTFRRSGSESTVKFDHDDVDTSDSQKLDSDGSTDHLSDVHLPDGHDNAKISEV